MPDNSVECILGTLIAKTDRLLAEQAWARDKLDQLAVCKVAYDEAIPEINERLDKLQLDVDAIKQIHWRFDGGATVAAWIGGLMLTAVIGAGAWALNWITGPNSPLRH